MRADFLNIASYVILNLLLSFSWYFFLFKKKDYLSFTDRLIGTFILSLTQIIFTEMLLGVVFKKLYAMPLFLLNTSISSGVLILALKQNQRIVPRMQTTLILQEVKNKIDWFFSVIKADLVLLCIFGLFLISVCWMIFLGYLLPSYAWDALWYHLPMVGYIIQNGAIQENPTPFLISFINTLPKNIELFFLWNTIFFKSDIIVDLSQLPFSIAGVLTIYSMCIKLKIKREYAIYSSFLFFFTPVIILQSTTNYVDIAVSVLFLIAINFLMYDKLESYADNRVSFVNLREIQPQADSPLAKKIPILLSGLTTGILLGSKLSGPIFVVVLLAVIMIQEFIGRINLFNIKFPKNCSPFTIHCLLFYLIYFITPIFLMGGYWYIKNWVLYNNPVYPMEVSLFNITLFKGLWGEKILNQPPDILNYLIPVSRPFYIWLEKVRYYFYDSTLSGFGPMWFILFMPSIVFSLGYAVKKKRYNFLFISMIIVVTFFIYPDNWNTRYVIFIVGLGAVSFGLVLDYFDSKGNILKLAAFLLVVFIFFSANSPCITPSKIKEFISLSVKERTIARHAPWNIDWKAHIEYGYWIWISNNVFKNDTLAYTFDPLFLYPLWNSELSNKIVYIKSEDYKDYNKWMEELKRNDVTYVLIRQNSIEDKWIDRTRELLGRFWWFGVPQEKFRVVYSDKIYKVVRVIK